MSADAQKKPRVDPLLQLYKEAAWAIKWVDDGLYQALTAPAGDEDAKRAQLIEFFRDQGNESGVVLNGTGELNGDGKGILHALLEMSKSAPASRPAGGSGGDRSRRRQAKSNDPVKESYRPFAVMLRALKRPNATELVEIVGKTFGLEKLGYRQFAKMITTNVTYIDLPPFDSQVKLYNAIRKVAGDDTGPYRKALFEVIDSDDSDDKQDTWDAITEKAALPDGEKEFHIYENPEDILMDRIAIAVVNAYTAKRIRDSPLPPLPIEKDYEYE